MTVGFSPNRIGDAHQQLTYFFTPHESLLNTMKAVLNDAVIAESDDTVVVEGNHYFPPESLDATYLEPSDHRTTCPWKGEAHYYDVVVDGKRKENAAWYYPSPSEKAAHIKDHVAFYTSKVEVSDGVAA
jgi:uncharacterized protein (DUF427 family)